MKIVKSVHSLKNSRDKTGEGHVGKIRENEKGNHSVGTRLEVSHVKKRREGRFICFHSVRFHMSPPESVVMAKTLTSASLLCLRADAPRSPHHLFIPPIS